MYVNCSNYYYRFVILYHWDYCMERNALPEFRDAYANPPRRILYWERGWDFKRYSRLGVFSDLIDAFSNGNWCADLYFLKRLCQKGFPAISVFQTALRCFVWCTVYRLRGHCL